jgi:hypothetical protein
VLALRRLGSKNRHAFAKCGKAEFSDDFPFHPTGIGDYRSQAHLHNVTVERRRRAKNRRESFAKISRSVKRRFGQTNRLWIMPMFRQPVKKLLHQHRLVIA